MFGNARRRYRVFKAMEHLRTVIPTSLLRLEKLVSVGSIVYFAVRASKKDRITQVYHVYVSGVSRFTPPHLYCKFSPTTSNVQPVSSHPSTQTRSHARLFIEKRLLLTPKALMRGQGCVGCVRKKLGHYCQVSTSRSPRAGQPSTVPPKMSRCSGSGVGDVVVAKWSRRVGGAPNSVG